MSIRIGIAGFMQESNSFAPRLAEVHDFDIRTGEGLIDFFADTNAEIAGFVDGCKERGWKPVPLLAANAISGGPLSKDSFERIWNRIAAELQSTPIDGLLLALHGAMSVEHFPSGDAEIVRRVRQAVGPKVRIAVSHDFHANVSSSLLKYVNGLSAYRTYPHIDQRETGQRASSMLAALLAGQPSRHWHLPIPLLLSPETSSTFQPPLGPVMHSLTSNFAEANGDHASLFCVQPWLDFTPVTSSLTITQFGKERDVTELMKTLASKLWKIRDSFVIDWVSPTDLLSKIETIPERPVLVSEAPDSPTGGASGDHTGLLTCLLPRAQELRSCIYLVDAQFAERAHSAGIGTALDGYIGAGIDRRFSQPRYIKGRVEHLSDGVFTAKGPAFHGRPFSMGPTAILGVSNLRIVVASKPVMMIDPELYRSQGIEPGAQDVVGIKSSLLFRPAYEPISRTVLHLDMPGPCRGRLEKVAYKHINRPIYPLDNFDWIPPAPEKFTPV